MNIIKFCPLLLVLVVACTKQSPVTSEKPSISDLRADYVAKTHFIGVDTYHNLNMKFELTGKPFQYFYKVDSGNWILAGWYENQNIITSIPGNHVISVKVVFYGYAVDSTFGYFKNI